MRLESVSLRKAWDQGMGPAPEKFLMCGVDVYPTLSSLALMMSHRAQDLLKGLSKGGSSTRQNSP